MEALMHDMKNLSYLIIGGDDRFVELARLYRLNGYTVRTYGMDKVSIDEVENFCDLDEAVKWAKVIIGPIPFTVDVNKVNAKYSNSGIFVEELLSRIGSEQTFVVGAINNYSKKLAEKLELPYLDYYADEPYQIMNTIPTVEGTLAIMINETSKTVFGSKVMVLGYGRIGKLLSEYLKSLGAEVYVEARKDHDLAWIEAKAMYAVPLNALANYLDKMDIIINTIPSMILDENMLDKISREALLIDLASMPGGIDFDYAESLGIKTIHALGIPGKVAYKSAAKYIYDTINKMLSTQQLRIIMPKQG